MKQNISALAINICIATFMTALSIAEVYWLKYNMHFTLAAAISVIGIANGSLFVFYYVSTQTKVFWFTERSMPAVLSQGFVYAVVCLFVVKWTLDSLFPFVELMPLWGNTFYVFGIKSWILLSFFGMVFYLGNIIELQNQKINIETNVQQLKNDAELFKLRQQLHPHFLFNSLNSINALIGINPKLAREMLMKLSTFLRQTLKKEDDELVYLSNELEELDLYLDIEKVRFGDRLLIEKSVPERISDIKIPPFLLQPLVENAIKFGLYGTLGDVTIVINFTEMEHFFKFEISNPFDIESIAPKGTGFGLKSISRRLYLLYARNDLLKTDRTEGAQAEDNDYYTARLFIPKETIYHQNEIT
ncbi:sensor histidine kinase [Taibaiella sp. KBW10]|uniref:sensor histidine kinase n=1 Tax=Taibaiella sp. KBW10 TaxID=2153357 RepID=UPI000F5B3FDD|nr:histidine kinase [Taibaiella sp. KBW10]RQO30754.1 sensor histidine kinase [Taibaiella sp. KBW10]